jgi:ParB-like chromosome segregation protein Spo0J
MEKKSEIIVKDIPMNRLVPTNTKKFSLNDLDSIRMSMEAIEMLEPLSVCKDGEKYLVVGGNKRYQVLLEDGHESAPCVLVPRPDTYTPSYQVIDVSPTERTKMVNKVLETVDKNRVNAAIGKISRKPVLDDKFIVGLSQDAIRAFKDGSLSKHALQELKNVTPKRQAEILRTLAQTKTNKTYNLDTIKTQILATLPTQRVERATRKRKTPWEKNEERMDAITKRLEQVQQQSDLLSSMYHTYVSDITKQLIYIRGFMEDDNIRQYVEMQHPEVFKTFCEIMRREC